MKERDEELQLEEIRNNGGPNNGFFFLSLPSGFFKLKTCSLFNSFFFFFWSRQLFI